MASKFTSDPKFLSLVEHFVETQWREKAIGPVSAPLGMFLETMSTMFDTSTMFDREDAAKRNPEIKKYIQLAKLLEECVLGGSVDFSTPKPDPNREILFKPNDDINLELAVSSSMIKELAPLVFYLRYLLQPGDLLVIDEPELNLHPAAQVQIIEFLAMLVNSGLHILITTHSTYVIDHLTNLMDAFKHKNQEEIVEKFLLEKREAFISQEKVAVYGFDDGQVSSILDPQGIIDWKTFSDVTRLVERIHFELSGE